MEVWYYLDDLRDPPLVEGVRWVVFRDPDEFLERILEAGLPDGISFDHDLGESRKTGYDVAVKLLGYVIEGKLNYKEDLKLKTHSANPVGAKRILLAIEDYRRLKYYL